VNIVLVAAAKPSDESICRPLNEPALYFETVWSLSPRSELFLSRQLTFSPTVCVRRWFNSPHYELPPSRPAFRQAYEGSVLYLGATGALYLNIFRGKPAITQLD